MEVMVHELGFEMIILICYRVITIQEVDTSKIDMSSIDEALTLVDIIGETKCDVVIDPFAET